MPGVNANRILKKFEKLHRKYKGNDRPVSFVKYGNAQLGLYKQPVRLADTITPIVPPPIIKDQPDEDIAASFGGGIESDQKIFKVIPTSFVAKVPDGMTTAEGIASLSDRAEQFLLGITGQTKGCIRYGTTDYSIEKIVVRLSIGQVQTQYLILARAIKKASATI